MKINPKEGVGKLLFGMRRSDVENKMGKPDREFEDEESNVIWLYNTEKLRLTFYGDEDYRFGYAICSHPELEVFGSRLIGKGIDEVKALLKPKDIQSWEREEFDLTVNYFNEANWMILQTEFDEVTKVEIGALINDKDELEWAF